jgi:hypothetical protein
VQYFINTSIASTVRPTRITQHTATLIDNIFTNDIETIESSTKWLTFCDISDQKLNLPVKGLSMMPMFNHLLIQLKIYHGKMCFLKTTRQSPTTNFSTYFQHPMRKLPIPLTKKVTKRKIDKNRNPWMTSCIAKSVKQKNKLYKKYL